MIRMFTWATTRIRAFLGLDWIVEAREIAENTRRNNMVEEQLRGEDKRHDA